MTPMMTSLSAVHPEIPSLTKSFCPCFYGTVRKSDFSGFSADEDCYIINHQKYFIVKFSFSSFSISHGYTLYLLLKVCDRLSMRMSHVLSFFISLVSVPFCVFNLPYRSHVPNRWLKYYFFQKSEGVHLMALQTGNCGTLQM